MSLLYTDGFELQDYTTRYPGLSTGGGTLSTSTSTRLGSGRCLTVSGSGGGSTLLPKSVTPSAQLFIGAALYHTSYNDSQTGSNFGSFLIYGDTGATLHLRIGVSGGRIYVCRGTTVIATSALLVNIGQWYYMEVSATINSTTGTVVVRVNGSTVINFTGNTKNGGTSTNIDTFALGPFTNDSGSLTFTYYDDLYVCNSLGSVNNSFLGDSRVQTLLPVGAGSSTQFTPTGSASNYANVNDVPDSASTYNGSSTSGQRDTYAMGDLLAGTAKVAGIQQITHAFNSDAGTGQLKAAQLSGATVSYGATNTLGTSNSAYYDVFETNPATGSAYSVADVNTLEGGAEVV